MEAKWVQVARVEDFPENGGRCFKHDGIQIAIYRFGRRNEWYATQNLCPHKQEMVLSRGMLGDSQGTPKVACPLHKSTFSLKDGSNLNGDLPSLKTYKVKVVDGMVLLDLSQT